MKLKNKSIKVPYIALLITVAFLTITFVVGCNNTPVKSAIDAEKQNSQQTKQILNEMNRQLGLPNIKNFFEKKTAKKIFELRDDSNLITHAYTQNLDGRYVYLGKCIGYGLPYSVQYTNPQKIVKTTIDIGGTSFDNETTNVIAQPDPNGLYMPEGLSATWLMYINPETKKSEPLYMESEITVLQSKLPRRLCAEWSLPKDY